MKVRIIAATKHPKEAISLAAGTCYGKEDFSENRIETCFKSNHMSVFEHASVTFKIEGISRACSHQLVRHRLASFCQESQRYNRYDLTDEYWYVIPDGAADKITWFRKCMRDVASAYHQALNMGIKPEDARYLLPEATKTNVTMTMNCRELLHFMELRTDMRAQWEIRDLANEIIRVLQKDKEYSWLIRLWTGK